MKETIYNGAMKVHYAIANRDLGSVKCGNVIQGVIHSRKDIFDTMLGDWLANENVSPNAVYRKIGYIPMTAVAEVHLSSITSIL